MRSKSGQTAAWPLFQNSVLLRAKEPTIEEPRGEPGFLGKDFDRLPPLESLGGERGEALLHLVRSQRRGRSSRGALYHQRELAAGGFLADP